MCLDAGERLRGRAAAKLAALAQRLSDERRCYFDVAWAGAVADRARYEHMHPHIAALVQATPFACGLQDMMWWRVKAHTLVNSSHSGAPVATAARNL